MLNAAIIAVGNELLNGYAIDTNSKYLAQKLINLSVDVVYSCCVPDDISVIAEAIKYSFSKADIVLITGGLGPTDDDITRNAIAEFLKVDLEFRKDIFDKISDYFKARNYSMPQRNRVQACFPSTTEEIENLLGTAPGIFWQSSDGRKLLVSMPGVPSEMQKMFEDSIVAKIRKISGIGAISIRKVHCIGVGESALAETLGDMMARDRNPLINCTVSSGIITLHIIAKAEDKTKAENLAEYDVAKLTKLLGDLVYGFDEQNLVDVVAEKLRIYGRTLCVAESCTGGLVSKMLTDSAGASEYFKQGWITYSNQAKTKALGINPELFEKYGAVSRQVAVAMAEGALANSGCDLSVAITGIAGPSGGSEQKPVGLVYISVADRDRTFVEQFLFGNRNRDFIRLRAAQNALNLLRIKFCC